MSGILSNSISSPITTLGVSEYQDATLLSKYTYTSGLVVVPRAQSQPRLVRLFADYGMRQVDFRSSRSNRPPVIPSATNTDTDLFLSGALSIAKPRINDGGTGDWLVEGSYQYLQGVLRSFGGSSFPTAEDPLGGLLRQSLAAITTYNALVNGILTGTEANTQVVENALSSYYVNHDQLFQWPYTFFPKDCFAPIIQ